MRRTLVTAAVAATCAATAATALAATKTVKVGDNYFVRSSGNPHAFTVKKGTKVTFKWVGDNSHNVTVTKGPVKFHSATKSSGTYSRTLKKTGKYTLVCTVHGPDQQKLVITVKR